MPKKLKFSLGDIYYRVRDHKKFEVAKVDKTGAYFCCFDGSSSDVQHIWYGISEADFSQKFASSYEEAFKKHVLHEESQAKILRGFYEKNILNNEKLV
jgi:hypothetical protein